MKGAALLKQEPHNSLYVDKDSTVSHFTLISLTLVASIKYKKTLNTQIHLLIFFKSLKSLLLKEI